MAAVFWTTCTLNSYLIRHNSTFHKIATPIIAKKAYSRAEDKDKIKNYYLTVETNKGLSEVWLVCNFWIFSPAAFSQDCYMPHFEATWL